MTGRDGERNNDSPLGPVLVLVCLGCASWSIAESTDVFNVKNYGAKGDGKGDDAPKIAKAIAAAAPSGGTVYFPPGTYALANPLAPPANVTLLGSGRRSSFLTVSKLGTFGNRGLIEVRESADRVQIRDLGFVGAGSGYQAIAILGAEDVRVERCWFDADFWWAVFIGSSARAARISDVISEGTLGAHSVEINDSSYCEIADSHLKNSRSNGVEIYQRTAGECVGNRIVRNNIDGAQNSGVALIGDRQSIVSDNTIHESGGNAIRGLYSEVLGSGFPSSNAVISGNVLVGNGGVGGEHGIAMPPGTVGWTVREFGESGSCVSLPAARCVRAAPCSRTRARHLRQRGSGHVIASNIVVDNAVSWPGARDGIRVDTTSGATIIGNRTGNTGASTQQGYGILLLANAINNILTGNLTLGNMYAGLATLGTGNTLTGNR